MSKYHSLFWLLTTMTVSKGQLIYVNSAAYKFIVGFSIPIELQGMGRTLAWACNIQGIYREPDNLTYFEPYKIVSKRSIRHFLDRPVIYETIEKQINRVGLPGRECIERFVCEAGALADPAVEAGRVGRDRGLLHLLTILFTPSEDNMDSHYLAAHQLGSRNQSNCAVQYNCSTILHSV